MSIRPQLCNMYIVLHIVPLTKAFTARFCSSFKLWFRNNAAAPSIRRLALLVPCQAKCKLASRIICLGVIRGIQVVIDHVERSSGLIGRNRILSPAQNRLRDDTGLACQTKASYRTSLALLRIRYNKLKPHRNLHHLNIST